MSKLISGTITVQFYTVKPSYIRHILEQHYFGHHFKALSDKIKKFYIIPNCSIFFITASTITKLDNSVNCTQLCGGEGELHF